MVISAGAPVCVPTGRIRPATAAEALAYHYLRGDHAEDVHGPPDAQDSYLVAIGEPARRADDHDAVKFGLIHELPEQEISEEAESLDGDLVK